MPFEDCSPSYSYRPNFTPTCSYFGQAGCITGQDCKAPSFLEKRARLFAGGTFFRSKNAGSSANLIAVEVINVTVGSGILLNVYNDGTLVETYGPVASDNVSPCSPTAADDFRSLVNANTNSLIEMPPIDYGGEPFATTAVFDEDNAPEDMVPGDDCMNLFPPTNLSGGEGPPTDDQTLASIRTGPERSLVIVKLTEIINNDPTDDGKLVEPPFEKVRQWNGVDWVGYAPNSDCVVIP